MEYAETILPLFYGQHVCEWNKNSSAEVSLRADVGGVPITGKLDRIEMLSGAGRIDVVDDKSGNFAYAKKKLQPPAPEKVAKLIGELKMPTFEALHGGDYWRQAVFYKILAEADKSRDWTVEKVRFEFIEPDKDTREFREEVVIVEEGDVETVQAQIKEVYAKIRNKEFAEGCGDPECEWCQFVARLEVAASVDEFEPELLLAA